MIQPFLIVAAGLYSNRFNGLRTAFNKTESNSSDLAPLLGFIAGVLGLVAMILVVRRICRGKTDKPTARRPSKLFTVSLKQMGVSFSDRILMRIIASKTGLKHPTLMLLSPELLERHAGGFVDEIGERNPLREYARTRLDGIASKAFATPPASQL
ncbi:MAG: hypothetical protein ABII12_00095 [Planctomycetota bacterium]